MDERDKKKDEKGNTIRTKKSEIKKFKKSFNHFIKIKIT